MKDKQKNLKAQIILQNTVDLNILKKGFFFQLEVAVSLS